MTNTSSFNNRQPKPKRWPQQLAVVMAFLAFVLFGGGWWLNQKYANSVKATGPNTSLSPLNGQKVWVTGQELFRFEWAAPTSESTVLEVSRDAEFNDLVLDKVAPKSPFLTDQLRGEGEYYYRLVEKYGDEVQVVLPPVKFTVISKAPPQLIYPFNPMEWKDGKPLRFYWQAKRGVPHYRIQLGFDKNFEHLLSDFLVDEPQTAPQNIPVGEFFWRVRGEVDAASTSNWSEVRSLHVDGAATVQAENKAPAATPFMKQAEAPVPAPTSPSSPSPVPEPPAKKAPVAVKSLASPGGVQNTQKLVLTFSDKKKKRGLASVQDRPQNPPDLMWKKVPGATNYEVQVAKKSDFSKVEWTKTVSGNRVHWDEAKPGHYYWRVRAKDKTSLQSAFSAVGALELGLPAPKIKKSFSHQVKVKSLAEMAAAVKIPIGWERVAAASGYRVLVANNPNFEPSQVDMKVDRQVASVPLVEGGNYFVKVAALGADGEVVSNYSKVAALQFEKKSALPAPKKAEIPAPVAETKSNLAPPRLKLPPDGSSIVSLNGTQDPISFKWEAVAAAQAYRLEIAADSGFKKVVHSTLSRENKLIVTQTLPRGRIYWRLRAERGNTKSDWSPTFSFEFSQ